jgi:hypothetical protein
VTDRKSPLGTGPTAGRSPLGRQPASSADARVAALRRIIEALVANRQDLRARGASRAELESNRLMLGSRQRQLSCAFIEKALPRSAACGSQYEPERLLRAGPVLAHERLAA